MGLDIFYARTTTEHAFRAGSYGGFGYFREVLAAEEDIVLSEMYGFGGRTDWHTETSLLPLLDHSDCDGELSSYDAEDMLPRMKEISSLWENGHYNWNRKFPEKKLSDNDKEWFVEVIHKWIVALERIAASEGQEHLVFA